ncbi:hypothetical protein CSOJ01_08849 [Colletotrichum sojae]|uniref:Uncharacterized protein n=1 Tax=Colletotrichum sojae TaxID=2175907 RepID=A0A8H6J4L2_9PEZI|nr:hypothetical protein CSOJ01_08849 [Colletotrichum sojae]
MQNSHPSFPAIVFDDLRWQHARQLCRARVTARTVTPSAGNIPRPPESPADLHQLKFERFRWPAFALLEQIRVLRDPTNADSAQDPHQARAKDGTVVLHPISDEPYTSPPTSSLVTSISILDHYASRDAWEDLHTCCERMPYRAPPPLVVRTSSKAYVTIGDIVSQVTKYVNDLREDVLEALGAVGEYADSGQRSPDHTFWVEFSVTSVEIGEFRTCEELKRAWGDAADAVRRFRPGLQYQDIDQPLRE